jgi:squalene-hopene/tetraprenyl-beta-curcumene cyclase
MGRSTIRLWAIFAVASLLLCGRPTQAAVDPAAQGQAITEKALEYLKAHQQADGSWQAAGDPPAISAIVLKAFVQNPKYANDPVVDKGFQKLLSYQQPDGSIASDILATYNTAIAVSALASTHQAKYKDAQEKAINYLRSIQWTDRIDGVKERSKKVDEKDPNYGGWGYGSKGRADMSNVQLTLDALHDAGLKSDDPAFQAALKFVSRDQNRSESNDQPWSGDDGGFIYTPAQGGSSVAGDFTDASGKKMFRSYGSMTYAGLKSMIYAGLSKSDPRVKAAWDWIRKNWNIDNNPGMELADPKNPQSAESGRFYYYHTLARSLRAYGEPVLTDSKGNKHDWRVELITKLAADQKPDGTWIGTQRFMENKPVLSSAYAVLALQEAIADLKEHPAK